MFFEIAVLHLFGKFFKRHLWKSNFQQNCYLILATMLKKFILRRKLFKEFPESVKYSCYNRKIWTSKNKPNNSKVAGSLCLNYAHSCICFWVSCKSMKSKSWSPRMVTHTHTTLTLTHTHTHTHTHTQTHTRIHFCSKYYKTAFVRVTIFRHCTLKGWKKNGRIRIFRRVHCGTFFHPKNISCVHVFRSKISTGVQK